MKIVLESGRGGRRPTKRKLLKHAVLGAASGALKGLAVGAACKPGSAVQSLAKTASEEYTASASRCASDLLDSETGFYARKLLELRDAAICSWNGRRANFLKRTIGERFVDADRVTPASFEGREAARWGRRFLSLSPHEVVRALFLAGAVPRGLEEGLADQAAILQETVRQCLLLIGKPEALATVARLHNLLAFAESTGTLLSLEQLV